MSLSKEEGLGSGLTGERCLDIRIGDVSIGDPDHGPRSEEGKGREPYLHGSVGVRRDKPFHHVKVGVCYNWMIQPVFGGPAVRQFLWRGGVAEVILPKERDYDKASVFVLLIPSFQLGCLIVAVRSPEGGAHQEHRLIAEVVKGDHGAVLVL